MPFSPATTLIVVLTGLVSWRALQRPALLERLLFSTDRVVRGREYERLLTSGFIHGDLWHLIFNMFSFYVFAENIEGHYGASSMLLIYFAGILGGHFLSLFVHRGVDYRSLGASGGVCGIIYAHIFMLPGGGIVLFPIPVSIPTWLFAILYLIGSYVAMRGQRDNIGHDAHLGGAVIGLLTATALYPEIAGRNPLLYGAILGISGLLFVHLVWRPLRFHMNRGLIGRRRTREDTHPRYSTAHLEEGKEVDRLLEKISRQGLQSLTLEEQKFLQEHSDELRRRSR